VKISGLGVPGRAWTADSNRELVLGAIERFGIARAMFASNFPVDGLCASFDAIVTGVRTIVHDFPAAEQRALFHDNAIRIYDME
jgi:predicted TIM-barrel fold metal-dependent hydrolase